MNQYKAARGLTLLELLIVIGLLTALAAVAVPSFSNLVRTNSLTSSTTNFINAINLARSEAVTRSDTVIICKRSTTNTAECNNSGAWNDGWIVFQDNGTDAQALDSGDNVIRYFDAMRSNLSLSYIQPTGGGLSSSGTLQFIAFQPRGNIQVGAGNFPEAGANFVLCTNDANNDNLSSHARSIGLTFLGRVNISTGASADSC